MARALKKKIGWKQLAWITAIGFAWTKLGVGTAVTDIMPPSKPSDPCPPGMQRRLVGGRWICLLRFD